MSLRKCRLGSPVREICTLGSAWGDEFKSHARSVRALARKRQNNSEAPQRATASRLVSTILIDLWADRWRHREAVGNVVIVRYADDVVIGFELEKDARRFWDAMRDRLREFSLSLHPEK